MAYKEKKEQLHQKIRKIRNFGLIALGLSAADSAFAQNDSSLKEKDISVSTQNIDILSQNCREFLNIVEINSISEIDIAGRNAAEYSEIADAVIYTQYTMQNADKGEKSQLEFINNKNHSLSSRRHELTHRLFASVSEEMYNGDSFVKLSDRARIRIFQEVCCAKNEINAPSIKEAIAFFKSHKREETYSRHYTDHSGYALLAVSAEEKVPDKINKNFKQTNSYKKVVIDNQEYHACLFTSEDQKYRTYCLFGGENGGDLITASTITAKSSIPIGTLMDRNNKTVKTADGKNAVAIYSHEGRNAYGGYNGLEVFNVSNIKKETQGYTFTIAEQNAENLYSRIAQSCGLSAEELQTLKEYVKSINLDSHDLSNHEIADLRSNYKGYGIAEMQKRCKANYLAGKKLAQQKFKKDIMPYLKEITPVNLVSPSQMAKIDKTSFYQNR